ncbi:hypothetical protein B0H21DRAFT_220341 [Amylocystis lapponica]|nr:hypothetical protein B0H21DRAFT_220341 [Amylocystis lapponica]
MRRLRSLSPAVQLSAISGGVDSALPPFVSLQFGIAAAATTTINATTTGITRSQNASPSSARDTRHLVRNIQAPPSSTSLVRGPGCTELRDTSEIRPRLQGVYRSCVTCLVREMWKPRVPLPDFVFECRAGQLESREPFSKLYYVHRCNTS